MLLISDKKFFKDFHVSLIIPDSCFCRQLQLTCFSYTDFYSNLYQDVHIYEIDLPVAGQMFHSVFKFGSRYPRMDQVKFVEDSL